MIASPGFRRDNTLEFDRFHIDGAAALAKLLVARIGQPLPQIWQLVSGGSSRIPMSTLPERLATAGAGVLAPLEVNQLHQMLRPAPDGTIDEDVWDAAFGNESKVVSVEYDAHGRPLLLAGRSTSGHNAGNFLPHERSRYLGTHEDYARPPPGHWPGGHSDVELEAMERRLASEASALLSNQAPCVSDVGSSQPKLSHPAAFRSPTYSIQEAPFAAGPVVAPRAAATRVDPHRDRGAPFATPD